MNKCSKCGVFVYENQSCCPLCFEKFSNNKETVISYPKYEDIIKNRTPLKNLPLFLSISAGVICFFINLLMVGSRWWSIIVIFSLIYSNVTLWLVNSKKLHFGRKVLIDYLILAITLIIIDIVTGMRFWSTDYVFPFLSFATTCYLMYLSLRTRAMFVEYFGYILVSMIISFIPAAISFVLLIIGFNYVPWGVFSVAIGSLIITFGLYLFADDMLKQELKKKFHN